MNVFEERGVKAGDYVEFTITTKVTNTYDGVAVESTQDVTYKGTFRRLAHDGVILDEQFFVTLLRGAITLDVVVPAPYEEGWHEVAYEGFVRVPVARYWNGEYWSSSRSGVESKGNYTQIRFIGK